jgi:hypothetical protein
MATLGFDTADIDKILNQVKFYNRELGEYQEHKLSAQATVQVSDTGDDALEYWCWYYIGIRPISLRTAQPAGADEI